MSEVSSYSNLLPFFGSTEALEAFGKQSNPDRLKRFPVAQKREISLLLESKIRVYENGGNTTVTCLKTASKIITLSMILFVVFSSIAPMYIPQYSWLPWAGIGGYFVLTIIQGVLESNALAKERRYAAMQLYKEMLPLHHFYPLTEADLTPVDKRLKSDQLLKETLVKTHPPNAERIVKVMRDGDLDAEIGGKALAAAQLGQMLNPAAERNWKVARKYVKRAKKDLFQDHPGRIMKWIKRHLWKGELSAPQRVDKYREKIGDAKDPAYEAQGAYPRLIGIEGHLNKIPREDPLATLQRTLLPFEKLNRELESLEKLYNEGKKLYEKAFPSLDQSIFSLPKYEEFNSAAPPFLGAIKFFKDTLQEKEKFLSRSKALSPYRQVIAIEMISQLNTPIDQIKDLLKVPSTYNRMRQMIFAKIADQLKHMKEQIESYPELACLAAWLAKSPFFSGNEINNEKIIEWLANNPSAQLQSITTTCLQNFEDPVFTFIMNEFIRPGFPVKAEQEEAWIAQVTSKIKGWSAHFAVGRVELQNEVETWITGEPSSRITKMDARVSELKSHERIKEFSERKSKIILQLSKLKTSKKEISDQESYKRWSKECDALEKKVEKLFYDMRKRPVFQRIKLMMKARPLEKPREAAGLSHPQIYQRKVEELELNKLLSKMDRSIARNNRFQRVFVEKVAITILLVVEVFVFSNAWAGFGITLGLVGIFALGRVVDYRLHRLQRQKQALRMQRQLRNPVPQENDFSFEKDWRRVRAGDLEVATLPGHRPQLRRLRDVANRYGLDETFSRHAETLIHSPHKIDLSKKGKKRKPPSDFAQEIIKIRSRVESIEEKRMDALSKELKTKKVNYAQEKKDLIKQLGTLKKQAPSTLFARFFEANPRPRYKAALEELPLKEFSQEKVKKRLESLQDCIALAEHARKFLDEKAPLTTLEKQELHMNVIHWQREKALLSRLQDIYVLERGKENLLKRLNALEKPTLSLLQFFDNASKNSQNLSKYRNALEQPPLTVVSEDSGEALLQINLRLESLQGCIAFAEHAKKILSNKQSSLISLEELQTNVTHWQQEWILLSRLQDIYELENHKLGKSVAYERELPQLLVKEINLTVNKVKRDLALDKGELKTLQAARFYKPKKKPPIGLVPQRNAINLDQEKALAKRQKLHSQVNRVEALWKESGKAEELSQLGTDYKRLKKELSKYPRPSLNGLKSLKEEIEKLLGKAQDLFKTKETEASQKKISAKEQQAFCHVYASFVILIQKLDEEATAAMQQQTLAEQRISIESDLLKNEQAIAKFRDDPSLNRNELKNLQADRYYKPKKELPKGLIPQRNAINLDQEKALERRQGLHSQVKHAETLWKESGKAEELSQLGTDYKRLKKELSKYPRPSLNGLKSLKEEIEKLLGKAQDLFKTKETEASQKKISAKEQQAFCYPYISFVSLIQKLDEEATAAMQQQTLAEQRISIESDLLKNEQAIARATSAKQIE